MSFEFDDIIQPECVVNTEPDPRTCQPDLIDGGNDDDDVVPPSDDERCADPAFAAANPGLCAGYPRLILKPEYAITESGSTVQYKTYLRAGGNEQELTLGLTYGMANPDVAVIESDSGLATGVWNGITTVSVAWQNLNAFAQIEVVNACADLNINFLLVIDNSKSAKVAFNGTYSSRLSYAKQAASQFASSVNWAKDKVGVAYFNGSGTIVLPPSSDEAAILAAIAGISSTDNKTNIHDALSKAQAELATATGRRVIIILSDGENNEGTDPVALANTWKDAGHVIVGVALRSWGTYFDLMYQISSGGFFLSAYDATAASVIETLKGLKSYLCAGDCPQTAGTYPMAQLNYTGFVNWNVFQGAVDLIGLGLWDVQPGNGLYVDLTGTRTDDVPAPSPGGISSKNTFNFTSGETYKFSIDVAGNNVGAATDIEPVKVTIKDAAGVVVYTRTITPTSHTMPFTTYSEEFTPGSNYTDCTIYIEEIEVITNNVGPLIDNVVLENVTTATVMLQDDFDDENPTTVPPAASYYGCLVSPPGAQQADPTPPTPPLPEG